MSDLLIRNIKPQLKRRLSERARKHGQSLSDEAQEVMERGLSVAPAPEKLGTFLFSLTEDRHRGNDLIFERNDVASPPPDFD
jgi:plasmid stability protein